ncbi:MAG: Ig-like domain-containing protein [Ruminococcaceae bacterium]|nr:Ig-like domain-containing protein [Oscillospiraceae bacterium]
MKRLLSALLTLALVISLVPAVFAEDTPLEQVFEFKASDDFPKGTIFAKDKSEDTKFEPYKDKINGVQYYVRSDILNYTTSRNWKLYDAPDTLVEAACNAGKGSFSVTDDRLHIDCASGYLNHYGDFSLSLRGEQTGFYVPHMSVKSTDDTKYINICLFFKNDSIGNYDTYRGDSKNCFVYAGQIPETKTQFDGTKAIYTENGKDLLAVFTTNHKRRPSFYNITLTEVQNAKLQITAENTDAEGNIAFSTENAGETVAITNTTVDGDNIDPMPVGSDFVKYVSDKNEVATVDENTGVITVGNTVGTAHITAQSPDGLVKSEPITVTVTAPEPEEPEDEAAGGKVSFAQTTNIDGFTGIAVDSVNRGASVTLTAHKQTIPGYKFIGWKRGADTSDKNAWVDITGDTYNVWTNTYLTAIYEKETDVTEKTVEFWNQNGAYLGKKAEADVPAALAITPKLTGFATFLGWFIDKDVKLTAETFAELKAGTTNAVAKYEASAISDVTFNGSAIAGADKYNADITLPATSDATTCWKRDGEIIAYGSSYKFNVWDSTDITEGTEEITDKVPVAILDYSANHKAYMLEYDAGDYEIVEAGIIFGKDTADIKTYTSQRKEKHNQFTVPEEGALEATGYIIYTLDNGVSYKTKYVSVKTEE